jgi:hypothetical protein
MQKQKKIAEKKRNYRSPCAPRGISLHRKLKNRRHFACGTPYNCLPLSKRIKRE